jgi:hypothetical protein
VVVPCFALTAGGISWGSLYRFTFLLPLLLLSSCQRSDDYRILERNDVIRQDLTDDVHFVIEHSGKKIWAHCDLSTIDKLDPTATCGLHTMRNFRCELGDMHLEKVRVAADLVCRDIDQNPVYLYVDKTE